MSAGPERRGPRWMRVALIASLAVNLLIVGAVAGALLRHGGPPPRGGLSFAMPYAKALPREARREMMRAVRETGTGEMLHRGARRAQYGAVLAALRAAPFDPEVLQREVQAQADAAWALRGAVQTEWLRQVAAMDAAERAAYADAVEARLDRRGGRKEPRD